MRITIGSILLGDYDESVYVGGFRASADRATQSGRGACDGLTRVRLAPSGGLAKFAIPTKRDFSTVGAAQKWVVDTAKAGGLEGALVFVFDDGSESRFAWATAKPTDLSFRGVSVTAVWQVEAGERLV